MKIRVVYHSITGNTKKIAEAIASAVGVTAEKITDVSSLKESDLIFLGDGNYAGKFSKSAYGILHKLQNSGAKGVALFGSYGGLTNALEQYAEKLKDEGLPLLNEHFGCKGQAWFFINRGQPDAKQLEAAKAFALRAVRQLEESEG